MHEFRERNIVVPKGYENSVEPSNNTEKIFQKKYNKKLFLESEDTPISLCDVYIEPRLVEKNLIERRPFKKESIEKRKDHDDHAIEYIKKFLEKTKDKVLFIEGVAGVGKSSLLSKMSTLVYGRDIFYKSLKEYLCVETIELKKEINKSFSLNDNDYGKTFFLDGLDEIWNRIDLNEFEDDLKFFIERDYKVIFTLRPGYVPYDIYNSEIKLCRLETFGYKEKEEWIKKYKQFKKSDLDDEIIKNILEDTKFVEITSIPIMLYIIANRNINIDSVKNMPQLYERVFDSLKEDKGNRTKKKLEKDYIYAQQIAYMMQKKGILTITKSEVVSKLAVDESFYSSVYLDKVIEGEEILEFVHKTIQEFFAAKWIYNQISYENYSKFALVLSEHLFSNEILANLEFFLKKECNKIGVCFSKMVCDGFPYYGAEKCNWKSYKEYIINIIINITNIYEKIINSNILIDGCEDIVSLFEIIKDVNEKLNKKNELKKMIFRKCYFHHITIKNYNFYNITFEGSRFNVCAFENVNFFQCTFLIDSNCNNITFKKCQFNNIKFYTNDKTITFEECTFVLYDSRSAKKTAIEIQKCNLDQVSLNDLEKNVEYYTNLR